MLPSALCPLTRPWALDNLHIYRWKLSNGRTISDEKCNARCLKNEIVSLGNILGKWWEHIKKKEKLKNPTFPHPKPKRHKNLPPDCMLSLPIGLHESFILKTVDYLLQLGLVPSLSPGYVRYYLGNFDTKYIISRKVEISKITYFKEKFFWRKMSNLLEYSVFWNENFRTS